MIRYAFILFILMTLPATGRGELTATLARANGQSRSYTLGPGTHQTTNVPNNLQLGRDPETDALTITRGNAVLNLAWGDTWYA